MPPLRVFGKIGRRTPAPAFTTARRSVTTVCAPATPGAESTRDAESRARPNAPSRAPPARTFVARDVVVRDARLGGELGSQPVFVRCRELVLASLREPAVLEWQHGFAALDESQRSQAVHLAAKWGWHDVSVATATRQNVFFDYALLYPRPYDVEVEAAAQLSGLERSLIYAVIRQESLYRADAVSDQGARGLAQLTPDTAQLTARRWSLPRPADLLGGLLLLTAIDNALLRDGDLLCWLAGDYSQVTCLQTAATAGGAALVSVTLAGAGIPEATWTIRPADGPARRRLTAALPASAGTSHVDDPDAGLTADVCGAVLQEFEQRVAGQSVGAAWPDVRA